MGGLEILKSFWEAKEFFKNSKKFLGPDDFYGGLLTQINFSNTL